MADKDTPQYRNELRRKNAGIELLRGVEIRVRDGSHLVADVYKPVGNDKHPVIMRLGIYGRAFTLGSALDESAHNASEEREESWHKQRPDPSIDPSGSWAETMVSANVYDWVPRGYVCVRVDGRGVGNVPGVIDPFSKTEAQDYYDSIEWAAQQEWSTGVVGLFGGSYNANTAWHVASLSPPSLRAFIPFAGDVDLYRELAHPGGLGMLGFLNSWLNMVATVQGRQDPDMVDLVQRLKSHPFAEPEHYGPHGDILSGPDFSKISVPFLTSVCLGAPVHGRGGAEAFMSGSAHSKGNELVICDANYWEFMYKDCLEQEFAFFDRHLKADMANSKRFPAVQAIMRTGNGEFQWIQDTQWPLTGTQYQAFFLNASTGTMSARKPQEDAVVSYSAEAPGETDDAGPCATFESAPLVDGLDIAGHISATLWVSATASDMDVYALLNVLDPQGNRIDYAVRPLANGIPFSHGALKVSRRALDTQRSTEYRPFHTHRKADSAPLASQDEIVEIQVELTIATARVPAGCRLQLVIEPYSGQSATAWRAYGGVAGMAADEADIVGGRAYDRSYHDNAQNRIHTGPKFLSKLLLPVVPNTTPLE